MPAANPALTGSVIWSFAWLTPWRCRAIFIGLVGVGLLANLYYLHHSPIDLSGDEAHYWDWSRNLDWSYYSKGPLVALIIRASCAVFGDTMPAVRYPALLLAAMTATVGYLLTLKLFRSDRLALGVTVLNALVPMFVAGSLLMTIDPPFFFCWAMATYFLVLAVWDRRAWAWPAAGVFVGIGALAKLAALAWLPAMLLVLALDKAARPLLKTAGPWVCVAIALACTTPIFVWNAQHDWVTFRHVGRQTGVSGQDAEDDTAVVRRKKPATGPLAALGRAGEMLGSQIGALGPGIAAFMVAGIAYALGRRGADDPHRAKLRMLAILGGGFFVAVFLLSLLTKVQANWPAPAYFTLAILAGYFLATRMKSPETWKPWRGWVYFTVVFGLMMQPIAHDFSLLYRLFSRFSSKFDPNRIDPTVRLRGWEEAGAAVTAELTKAPLGTFVLCDDYQQTALIAFYTAGQPRTYCAGSYYSVPKRHTQYDLWPDRRLDSGGDLLGRDAIIVGKGGGIHPDLVKAFERVEPLAETKVIEHGVLVRLIRPWRGYGFKGMVRPDAGGLY